MNARPADVRRQWTINAALVAAGILATIVAGCSGQGEAKTTGSVVVPKTVKVTVAPIERRTIERTVEVVGTLKGLEEVTLGAKKGGRVLKVLHDMGDRVAPGEPLVELDPVDARLAVSQAQSRYLAELVKLGITRQQAEGFLEKFGISERLLSGAEATELIEKTPAVYQTFVMVEKAQQNLTRQRQLNQRGAGTIQELQNMENDFRAAEATRDNAIATARNVIANAIAAKVALDVAEQDLREMTIRAPIPSAVLRDPNLASEITYGITKRSVAEGQMLRDGDPVFELVIEDPLRLWTNVPERYAAEVKEGQDVRIRVAAYPEEVFRGKVTRVNPAVDPISRTFQVETEVPNRDRRLHPGGFAKASIVTLRESEALTVPIESIVRFAGVTKIFVVEGDGESAKARAIEVSTGIEEVRSQGTERIGWVEVLGNVPAGGRVVTSGQTQLAEGSPVIVRDPEAERLAREAEEAAKREAAHAADAD